MWWVLIENRFNPVARFVDIKIGSLSRLQCSHHLPIHRYTRSWVSLWAERTRICGMQSKRSHHTLTARPIAEKRLGGPMDIVYRKRTEQYEQSSKSRTPKFHFASFIFRIYDTSICLHFYWVLYGTDRVPLLLCSVLEDTCKQRSGLTMQPRPCVNPI